MEKQWCYWLFLLWLSYLMITSILMFTRGFLLTRTEQTNFSSCTSWMNQPCTASSRIEDNGTISNSCSRNDKLLALLDDMYSSTEFCLPQNSKVLLIIIDALRYDFTDFDPTVTKPTPFQNKMPIFNELLKKYPNHSRRYKFLADAPTTTMQRLKGLTTGSLPTFVEAGSNFASHNISEDNIIDQMVRNNKRLVLIGDDIWDSIYPNRFYRKQTYPGFNTWDLDTVDNGVYEHLLPEIRKADWDMMIVHLSGVDHVGHRYGIYHNEIERKLTEMNDALRSVIDILNEDTLLYVISDHGTTITGDHGGNSKVELEAVMFAYSPSTPLISSNLVSGSDTIKQVDLVPTLASVLGVPIPFSSLGTIIFDAIPTIDKSSFPYTVWQFCLLNLWKNVYQITHYIDQYSKITDQFNKEKLETLGSKYKELLFRISRVHNEKYFQTLVKDGRDYMYQVRQMCEEIWIQFDSFSMSRGLLLMFLTIFFTYMIIDGIPIERLPEIFMSSFILCSYAVMVIVAIVSAIFYYLNFVENFLLTLCFSTGMSSIFMLAMLVIQNWEIIAIHWHDSNKKRTWLGVSCRLILLLSISGLFSNSYIVEEGSVLLFLSLTLVWLSIYNVGDIVVIQKVKTAFNWFKSQWTPIKIKLITFGVIVSVLIRSSQFFWRCREEQAPWCQDGLFKDNQQMSSIKSATTKLETIVSLITLATFITVTRIWLRSCGNLVGFSPTITIVRYMPSVIVVCMGGFWVLHDLPRETKLKLVASWQIDMFVWIIYVIIAVAFTSIFIQPLCVYTLPKKKERVAVYGRENIIPQLFNHVKGLYKEKQTSVQSSSVNHSYNTTNNFDDTTPIVCGLATVYSATYIVFSVFILLLFALLLGDLTAPSSVLMYSTAAVVLVILAIAQYERAVNIDQLFEVAGTNIFCWVLLCQYFFYGTGHQPTFPNIHWSAAFVGTGGYFPHNVIPGTLIFINTFGSHILFGSMIPLLLIAPFTLYIVFPNLAAFTANKIEERKEMKRGELMLYERDGMLLTGVFVICCKYILFYGIRMFICMLASTIHCRHLMVWSIFAPKLIFEGLGMFVTLPAVLISYCLLIRINQKVNELIVQLDKQYR